MCQVNLPTSRKVAGSIPDNVIGFFNWPNPSSSAMTLGSTQPLTEMNTRNLLGSKGRRARKADNRTPIYEPTAQKMWESRRLTTVWAYTAYIHFVQDIFMATFHPSHAFAKFNKEQHYRRWPKFTASGMEWECGKNMRISGACKYSRTWL
jgi:hypothetical protein